MEQLTKIKELLFEDEIKVKKIKHDLITNGEPCSITITNNTNEIINNIKLFKVGVDYGDKITINSNTLLSYEYAVKVIAKNAPFIGYTYFKFDKIEDICDMCLLGEVGTYLIHDPYQQQDDVLDFRKKYQLNGIDKYIELGKLMPYKSLTIHIFPFIDYQSNFKPNYFKALKIYLGLPFVIAKMWIKSIIK